MKHPTTCHIAAEFCGCNRLKMNLWGGLMDIVVVLLLGTSFAITLILGYALRGFVDEHSRGRRYRSRASERG